MSVIGTKGHQVNSSLASNWAVTAYASTHSESIWFCEVKSADSISEILYPISVHFPLLDSFGEHFPSDILYVLNLTNSVTCSIYKQSYCPKFQPYKHFWKLHIIFFLWFITSDNFLCKPNTYLYSCNYCFYNVSKTWSSDIPDIQGKVVNISILLLPLLDRTVLSCYWRMILEMPKQLL